jgi:threonyl-tRNA synthetase
MVYRDEQSGELSGLSRVRCITQDDSHVFCRYNQIGEEMLKVWDIIDAFYKGVGFPELKVRLSLHDPNNFDSYIGTKEKWEETEEIIRDVAKQRGVEYFEAKGEAAMYGPKIDFMAYDSLNREWQVATNQLDMNMPNRFQLHCINENGEKEPIAMLHVAIMGSIERFLSILIEHFAGAFPVWLSPVQVSVIPVSDKSLAYAQQVTQTLESKGFRVELDADDSSMQKRIRNAEKQKHPYMLVIGGQEAKNISVAVRQRGRNDLGSMKLDEFVSRVSAEIKEKIIW